MSEKQPSLENWDDFLGKYFKAEHVKIWPARVTVIRVDSKWTDEERSQLILEIEFQKRRYLFEPNVTNTNFIKASLLDGPKKLVGRNLVFQKIQARNPRTMKMVDSLQIVKVE